MNCAELTEEEHGDKGATFNMRIHFGRFAKLVAILFVLGVTSLASVAQGQSSASETTDVGARLTDAVSVGLTSDEIVARMLARNRLRNEQLRRYSAVRTYESRNLQGRLARPTGGRVD